MRILSRLVELVIFLAFFAPSLNAQWVPTNGPLGAVVNCIVATESYVFLGTETGDVWRAPRGLISWTRVCTGLTGDNVLSLGVIRGDVFAGTTRGLYRTSDDGDHWTELDDMYNVADIDVRYPTASTAVLTVATGGGVFFSTDQGQTWTRGAGTVFAALASDPATTFAGGNTGLWKSTNGTTWQQVASASALKGQVRSLDVSGQTVVAGTQYGGVSVSYDSGMTWTFFGPVLFNGVSIAVRDVAIVADASAANGILVYAATTHGVYCSDGTTGTWTRRADGLVPSYAIALHVDGATCYVGTSGGGVFLGPLDRTGAWSEANDGLHAAEVVGLAVKGKYLFTANAGGSVHRSADNGMSWTRLNAGIPDAPVWCIGATNTTVIAGMQDSVVVSQNDGWSWSVAPRISTVSFGVGSRFASGDSCIYTFSTGSIMRSRDGGDWSHADNALPRGAHYWEPAPIRSLAACDSVVLAWTDSGLCRSYTNGNSWSVIDNSVNTRTDPPLPVVAGRDGAGLLYLARVRNDTVALSMDVGKTWVPLLSAAPTHVASLAIAPNGAGGMFIYAGTPGRGVYRYAWGKTYMADMTLSSAAGTTVGYPIALRVRVGDSSAVKELKTLAFTIHSDQAFCTYVDGSAAAGPLMAVTQNGTTLDALLSARRIDAQTVACSLTVQGPTGVSGAGVAVNLQYATPAARSSVGAITFTISNVTATDRLGTPVYLMTRPTTVSTYIGHATVWPGDCNNDGIVSASDILPIGTLYGRSFGAPNRSGILWSAMSREYWSDEPPGASVYADANGDGVVNSADVLPVGINYGSTHKLTTPTVPAPVTPAAATAALADAEVRILSVARTTETDPLVHVRVGLTARKPVFGAALTLAYRPSDSTAAAARFVRIDTACSLLGGGLWFARGADDAASADCAITRIGGAGVTGDGALFECVFELPIGRDGTGEWKITNAVATDAKGIPRTIIPAPGAGSVTGVGTQSPLATELLQNFPNPFNPVTRIDYRLAIEADVRVAVFDVLGRQVLVLVNGRERAGAHTAWWNAASVSSGIYYYVMTTMDGSGHAFTATRRMTLLK